MRKETVKDWWRQGEITEKEVFLLAELYNTLVEVDFHKNYLKFRKTDKADSIPWYKDMVNVMRMIHVAGASPREFLQAQFYEYTHSRRHPLARCYPSVRMLAAPSAMDRWNKYQQDRGLAPKTLPTATVIPEAQILEYSKSRMTSLMKRHHIRDEETYFRDPVLATQLSRDFRVSNIAFRKLLDTGYYYTTFGLSKEEMLT